MVGFGVKEDNRDRLVESLEIVEMAWREGRASCQGQFHDIDDDSYRTSRAKVEPETRQSVAVPWLNCLRQCRILEFNAIVPHPHI